MSANTLFLRLEGPLQAWGSHESKFVIRRTAGVPTKSGVIGLLLAALGVGRGEALSCPARFEDEAWLRPYDSILKALCKLEFGVRVDRSGIRWWDFHTVGAGQQMQIAEKPGKTKPGALLSRREYLCDASFLVALRGGPELIAKLHTAMLKPVWTLYLGRKSCPPGRPLLEPGTAEDRTEYQLARFDDLDQALRHVPWRPRYRDLPARRQEWPEGDLDCYLDWIATPEEPEAPLDAAIWYDIPVSLDPPAHHPRFVLHRTLALGPDGDVQRDDSHSQHRTLTPPRPRAGYSSTPYRKARRNRLIEDEHLCVFCKSPATTVQHVTYRNAESGEQLEDLRALCRLCHDAITMLEYGEGMGLDRINPEDESWRERIIAKREEIIRFRSLETRRRRLDPTEVE